MPEVRVRGVPDGIVDISDPAFTFKAVSGFNSQRDAAAISWQPAARGALVTGGRDAAAALRCKGVREPDIAQSWRTIERKLGRDFGQSLGLLDYLPFARGGEVHKWLRTTIARAVAAYADRSEVFERCVERRLAEIRGRPRFDLVKDFSNGLVFDIFSELMGIREDEHEPLRVLSTWSWLVDPTIPIRTRDEVEAALSEFFPQLLATVTRILAEPGPTYLHALRDALADEERDRTLKVVRLAAVTLLMGNDPIAGSIAFTVRQLLSHQADDPASAQANWPAFADDAIRFSAPVVFLNRIATEEIEIGGCPFKIGDRLIVSPLAANHDPAFVGEDAGLVRARPGVGTGLAFGGGKHVCVGARMSRNIVRAAFAGLAGLPRMRMAGPGVQSRHSVVRTMESLPIEFVV